MKFSVILLQRELKYRLSKKGKFSLTWWESVRKLQGTERLIWL